MDVGAAVVADEQPLEVVEPGEGALDDPAVAAQPGAVLGLAACDFGPDPSLAQLPAVLVVVVAAVSRNPVGPSAGAADPTVHRRDRIDERDQLGDVVAVASRDLQASGIPVASTKRWCFEPFLALSTGLGPVSEPPFSPARQAAVAG